MTNNVTEWLNFYGVKFLRYDANEILNKFCSQFENFNEKLFVDRQEIKKIWHRRGKLNLTTFDKEDYLLFGNYLKSEYDILGKIT